MAKFEKTKAELEARLVELGVRVHELEDDLRAPLAADFEEQATEQESAEVWKELENNALIEARQIQSALGRIEDGSYGECISCGAEISKKRLAALPYATQCINCAS